MDCKACGKPIEGKNYVTGDDRYDVFHPACDPDNEPASPAPAPEVPIVPIGLILCSDGAYRCPSDADRYYREERSAMNAEAEEAYRSGWHSRPSRY